jgi:phosphate:Na+ symporter
LNLCLIGIGRVYGEIILGAAYLFGDGNDVRRIERVGRATIVASWFATMGQVPFVGVLVGTIATAIVQSSSAVTSLLVAMGISGAIELRGAIALLLGANIGSCVMGLIASLRLSRLARRASIAQILINVAGVLLFLPFITPFAQLVSHTSTVLPRQMRCHTIFTSLSARCFYVHPPDCARRRMADSR